MKNKNLAYIVFVAQAESKYKYHIVAFFFT